MGRLIRLAALGFGWQGSGRANMRHGWSDPERDFTWTIGKHSRLQLHLPPLPPGDGDLFLELHCAPFTAAPRLAAQRLTVLVNDAIVGDETLSHGGVAGFRIPARAIAADGTIRIELRHPNAARPSELAASTDTRELGFALSALRILHSPPPPAAAVTVLPPLDIPRLDATPAGDPLGQAVQAATGLAPDTLALRFESLGLNSTFGLLQRRVGAEPLGLLRFSDISMADLIAGLDDGFARAGDAVQVREAPGPHRPADYVIQDQTYTLSLHTFQTTDGASADQIRVQHTRRMRFLRAHFRAHLEDGDRIFVVQQPGRILACQALPLLLRLRDHGPGALLFVDQSPGLPPGAVEQLGHGFFHGALPAADALDPAAWLSVCANAYRLWTANGSF